MRKRILARHKLAAEVQTLRADVRIGSRSRAAMLSRLLPRRVHPRKRPCWPAAVISGMGQQETWDTLSVFRVNGVAITPPTLDDAEVPSMLGDYNATGRVVHRPQ